MGPSLRPGASKLIAVLLVTQTKPGPRLVFHFPREPLVSTLQDACERPGEDDSDQDSGSEEDIRAVGRLLSNTQPFDLLLDRTVPRDAPARRPQAMSPSETVLGYHIDSLEKLLSPGKWSDGKKFEVTLDGITFVGHPVYAGENGEWSSGSQSKSRIPQRAAHASQSSRRGDDANDQEFSSVDASRVTITRPDTPDRVAHDYAHVPESLDSQYTLSLGTSVDSTSTASGAPSDQMAMFQVIFATRGEDQAYANEIHEHVATKLTIALHYCQKHNEKMLALKTLAKQNNTTADELWTQLVEHSELAWALREVYEKTAVGTVAGIRLDGKELCLQIPKESTSRDASSISLEPHSGLLLLEDKDVLLRELFHPDASPLAYFIREHTPTKPLQKLATTLNIPLHDVLYLAQHLIKWRKARAIMPLHPRNTYVLRAEAPIERVSEVVQIYARRFAALPTLPQMLKVLSGKPIKYGLMIPSRDHRAPYMDILAFLDRYEFVAPLKTFGWLRAASLGEKDTFTEEVHLPTKPERPISGLSLLSPHLRPVEDDGASVSSGQTVITTVPAGGGGETGKDDATAQQRLILDPADPTQEEAIAIEHIKDSISDTETGEMLPRILHHFDGEHAFEEIAVKEGLKRAMVEDLLGVLEMQDHLVTFRAV
ncbi:Nitrogen permease regulator 3 [Teratosphaeriaceae sp. CCFEE 6253]|nr:Nitrogen permease regulator 3 [Teratosphaeriaceae sp. CCFEE 6253]